MISTIASKPLSAQSALLRKPARTRVAFSVTAGILSALALLCGSPNRDALSLT